MDMETVITHLQIIHTWAEFARERDLQFFTSKHLEDIAQWSEDAIELLEEQQEQIEIQKENFSKLAVEYATQPQIVRCKDCKNYIPHGIWNCRYFNGCSNSGDWFCADGERK